MTEDMKQHAQYFQQIAEQSAVYVEQLAKIRDFSAQLSRYLMDGWWLHLIQLIDTHNKAMPTLTFMPMDLSILPTLRTYAIEQAQQAQRRFPKLFEDACLAVNIPLDMSPHPRYTTDNYFIKITIDEGKKEARIENVASELAVVPMDVGAVVSALLEVRKRLFEREFDPKDFIEKLFLDYDTVRKSEKLKDGDAIGIRGITKRRGKNVKGFRVDEFSVDLAKLLRSGVTKTEAGYELRLEQTKNTTSGIFVPDGMGYVGFIRFVK